MAAVDRVLPWRRHQNVTADELTPLLSAYRRRHPKAPVAMINRAFETAKEAHRHQLRSSGESYINHPLAVARIVADIGLDEISLAAALLHDAVEDTEITLADVETAFGAEVAAIVDGVTKLERLQFDSKEAQQAATMRKMLVAMARDLRVLIIKLADRLHNMRTIAAMPSEKQRRIAQETLDIYAPLAHRLGMQELKQQLEDLSFASLYPKRFAELDHLVSTRTPEREVYLAKAIAEVGGRLHELNIEAEVTGRGKHLWSIYEKMIQKGKEFDDIFDLVAIRVIVDSVKDCYAALGCIHGRYKPVVGRFKDYIAMPKFNLYQSLHTTVIGPGGKVVEVQIRSREMHQRAEWGVAAHWSYKGEGETQRHRLAQPDHRLAGRHLRSRSLHGEPEDRPRAGRGLRVHAEGPGHPAAGRLHQCRLRLRSAHRGRSRVHRRQGQRSARAARAPRCTAATRARSSPPRWRRRARRATGCSSSTRLGPATRSASGSAASGVST